MLKGLTQKFNFRKMTRNTTVLILFFFILSCNSSSLEKKSGIEEKTETRKETDCSGDIFAYNLGRNVGGFKKTGDILGWGLNSFDEAFNAYCESSPLGLWDWKNNECVRIGYNDVLADKESPYKTEEAGSSSIQDESNTTQNSKLSETRDKTIMTLDKIKHEFEAIQQGDSVECAFRITNSGSQPLILEEVSFNCGCIDCMFPKEPIPIGESSEIIVKYNSALFNQYLKEGTYMYYGIITANTNPIETEISVAAKIGSPEEYGD